jgi:hypothetical protein
VPPPTIVSVAPTVGGFTAGTASGTVISAVSVVMSPAVPTFATLGGTLTTSGPDTASFNLSSSSLPSNLTTNGVLGAGTYNINIVPHLSGAVGDGVASPVVITGSAGSLLSTMTLVNTSATIQAADFITPMFGWVFHKGHIPSGTAPIFKSGTTPQAYSWGMQSYWSDGSLKFASFMLRCGDTVPGNGSRAIEVWSGGTAPTTSARTLTEVYAESIVANVTGAGTNFGLTGVLGGWLRVDANNVEQCVYLDGDAGKVWRVLTHMAPTIGGTRHGQMECYHYIAALTDASGNLGGFRYLPCLAQPWYDSITVSGTPIPKAIRSFTTVNWQHGAGPTTVPIPLGATTIDFTHATSSSINCTTQVAGVNTVSNYYTGCFDNLSLVPCYLTTTGTLPVGYALDTPYFCRGIKNSVTVQFQAASPKGGASAVTATTAGIGTHTIHPITMLPHFGRIFMPTVDGNWNFFHGSGSMSSDSTVRTTIDQTYWAGDTTNKLGLLAPWDLALRGLVTDAPFTYNWTPASIGSCTMGRSGGAGNASRPDLGAMTGWQGIDFLQQSANSERLTRINAFAGVNDLHCLRNSSNFNVVNMTNIARTGMSLNTTFRWYPDTNTAAGASGFTPPPTTPINNTGFYFDQANNAHKPAFFYYAYLRTGEPQFFDCMVEMAIGGTMELLATSRNPAAGQPAAYFGVASLWAGSATERGSAWGHRDLQCAAAVMPATMPDLSGVNACLIDMADDSISAMLDLGASVALMGSYAVTNHLWLMRDPVSTHLCTNQGFQRAYIQYAVAFAASARESTDAVTWLQHEADWNAYIVANFGYYCTTSYFAHYTTNMNGDIIGAPPITTAAMFGSSSPWDMSYSSTVSPNWTFTKIYSTSGAVLADGDKFLFNVGASAPLPANYLIDTAYYAINTAGDKCNLTTVAGDAGHIVVPASSGTVTANADYSWYVPVTDVPPTVGAENTGYIGSGSYMSWHRGALLWMNAIGVTGTTAAITDAGQRSGCTGTDPGFKADTRVAYQDHFGA